MYPIYLAQMLATACRFFSICIMTWITVTTWNQIKLSLMSAAPFKDVASSLGCALGICIANANDWALYLWTQNPNRNTRCDALCYCIWSWCQKSGRLVPVWECIVTAVCAELKDGGCSLVQRICCVEGWRLFPGAEDPLGLQAPFSSSVTHLPLWVPHPMRGSVS